MLKTVCVIDSGVGGLSVLKALASNYPYLNFVYVSDCCNMPYGNKNSDELKKLFLNSLNLCLKYSPDILVVGCNTLSVSIPEFIESSFCGKVIFTRPPVDEILDYGAEKCLLFCTSLTAKSRYLKKFLEVCPQNVIALPNLAKDIENWLFYGVAFEPGLPKLNNKRISRVYLGCTHYALIAEKFERLFRGCYIDDGTTRVVNEFASAIASDNKSASKKLNTVKNEENSGFFGKKPHYNIIFDGNGAELVEKTFINMLKVW